MFSINSLFILLSTKCSIVLQHILLLLPCGQQHPPLLALLATYASVNHFLSSEAPHKKHIPWKNCPLCMKCTCVAGSLQNILPGTFQQTPGGQAGQCSACAGVVFASNRDNPGRSCRQDAEMVPSGSIDLLTSGTYGSCRGQRYQDNDDGAS